MSRTTSTDLQQTLANSSLMDMESYQQLTYKNEEDLLEPQCYPDPILFRASLERLTRDEETLSKKLISNKATLRALAPYLQIFHKDQQKTIQSAKQKPRTVKVQLAKRSKEPIVSVVPDLSEHPELALSVEETGEILKSIIAARKLVTYLVDQGRNELYRHCDRTNKTESDSYIKIEEGSTFAAYVANKKESVLCNNLLSDSRFPNGLATPDSTAKFGLGIAVKTPDDIVLAVYEFTRDVFSVPFGKSELQKGISVAGWMGVAILQKSIYVNVLRQYELTDCLQQLTTHYHCSHAKLDGAISDIVVFAREAIGAQHCSFYLVIKTSKEYFIVEEYEQHSEDSRILLKKHTKTIVLNDGSYLSKVLKNKEVIRLDRTEVGSSDYEFRSMICTPVLCSCNDVIGAIQLINKRSKNQFSKDDEVTLQTFAGFFSVNFHHHQMNESAERAETQSNTIRDMLNFHIKPCSHVKEAVKSHRVHLPDNFFTFSWYPVPDDKPKLAELTISMFQEVLGESFMFRNNVPKFILTVQNCYRPNPYHNFLHAFAVTHTMANIVSRYHYIFNGVERKSLMVAALCHDVDHRGYTNNFIQLSKHYLSSLYSTSPLENHHFAVAKMIIEQCSMFSYFKSDIYAKLLAEIYKCIIATDLSLYFQCRMEFMRVVDEKNFTFKDPHHRHLVQCLIMTTCDLSGQTKPMRISKKITEDVYEEFYQQGDIEKRMGLTPLPTMDRNGKNMICENQVQFLSVVVLPCVETVSRIFSSLNPMVEETKILLKKWKELVAVKGNESKEQSILIS